MITKLFTGVELFFSYSHKDSALCEELQRHLSLLIRQGVISEWHDRKIGAGVDWEGEIDAHLESAEIVLLLVSSDFLSSDYCYDVEMRRAMARHAAGEARVIPVLLRAVEWRGAPFSRLQAVPTGGVPITSWDNRDEAFADVARAIAKAAAELSSHGPSLVQSAEPRPAAERVACYFPQLQRLTEEQARGVIGRQYVEEALDRFIASQPRGYFILEGGPGQGKTAISARLVTRRRLPHHFIGRTGRRSDPGLILSSFIVQLDPNVDPENLTPKAIDELGQRFDAALYRRANDAPPVVLLVDGLNELSLVEGEEMLFLPTEMLPRGCYVVVTSQPGERLLRLKEHLSSIPFQIYELGPLHTDEVRALILARRPAASEFLIDRMEQASLGNPLYLRAALDTLSAGGNFDADALPGAVDGYFRRATRGLADSPALRDVLGLLAVSRKSLSLQELSQITGFSQRQIDEEAVRPIRPYLVEIDGTYTFYHDRFHDFAVRELLYSDEIRRYHARLAHWIDTPTGRTGDYYWTSLAHHLFHGGDKQRLLERIDERFLADKLRRFGYSVLEDLELVAEALLSAGDASCVEECVRRLDGLRAIVGDTIVDDLARSVQPNQPAWSPSHRRSAVTRICSFAGIEGYGVSLPKREVTADFFEMVPRDGRLVVAIGDAPMSGLKSAFVARFVATLFKSLVSLAGSVQLGDVLGQLRATISRHPYFERVSVQCMEIIRDNGVMTMASAGHPYPVLYSTRYGRCDRLPVRGPLLPAPELTTEMRPYRVRHAEIGRGDVVVLVSDGITEGGPVADPYGYRFTEVVERHATEGARNICEAVLADWRTHLAGEPPTDDATILVLAMNGDRNHSDAD